MNQNKQHQNAQVAAQPAREYSALNSQTDRSNTVTNITEQQRSRVALGTFKERMYQLEKERSAINRELGSLDLMAVARRTRQLLRATKGLMDGNVTVLFANKPDSVSEELYKYLEYAEGHVTQALSQEYEFDVIKKRLFMATALGEYVIAGVDLAVREIEERIDTDI
jgi:hypothetical protein